MKNKYKRFINIYEKEIKQYRDKYYKNIRWNNTYGCDIIGTLKEELKIRKSIEIRSLTDDSSRKLILRISDQGII